MPSLIVVGHLKATDSASRSRILDQFHRIVQYAKSEEPGVLRYAITIPRDETDETSIYAIEEYATQQVSDAHLASSPVKDLISLLGSQPAVLAKPPKVYQLEYAAEDSYFTRPDIQDLQQPFIVFATAQVPSSSAQADLTATWQLVVSKANADEPWTLMYALVRDKEDPKQIGTIEVYKTESDFEAHCRSIEVGQLVSRNSDVAGKMSHVALKLHDGWLLR